MLFAKAKKVVFCFIIYPRIKTMGDDVIVRAQVVVTFIYITLQQIKVPDTQLVDIGLAHAHLGGGDFDACESSLRIEQSLRYQITAVGRADF